MSPEAATWQSEAVTMADEATRDAIMRNPQVQAGLAAYFERHARYGGEIPTIPVEELLRRIEQD